MKITTETKMILASQSLAGEIGILARTYDRISSASGEKFNLFSVLKVERNEVRTHSRFLAELLNPKGRHGMGSIFLKLFLENTEIQDFNHENASVRIEFNAGKVSNEKGGRIDIVIKSGSKFIVIENKIDALEQENQLLRYKNAFHISELFFLTLYGDESKQHGQLDEAGIEYRRISYEQDISQWLEACMKAAYNISQVRESIGQYLYLVKKLTGQNVNQEMNKEIAEIVVNDSQRYDGFSALMGASKEIRKTILRDHLIPLLEEIAVEMNKDEVIKENYLKPVVEKEHLLNYSKPYKSFKYKSTALRSKNINFLKFEFNVNTKGYDNLIFGITLEQDLAEEAKNKIKQKLVQSFKEVFGYEPDPGHSPWAMHAKFEDYQNWNNWEVLGKVRSEEFKISLKEKVMNLLRCAEALDAMKMNG